MESTVNKVSKPWRKYTRTNIAEMRPYIPGEDTTYISVSDPDRPNLHLGGYVARNPDNHKDVWFIAADYHEKNFQRVPFQIEDVYELGGKKMKVVELIDAIVTLEVMEGDVPPIKMSIEELITRGYHHKLVK